METQKEHWIEATINSTDGLQRMPVPERLRQRLEAIPATVTIGSRVIPLKAVWLTAASLAILVTVNIAAFRKADRPSEPAAKVYSDYFSYLDQGL